ncbi:MAG: hypothetical protein ACHP7D_03025 [Lysobacterales bacterium]
MNSRQGTQITMTTRSAKVLRALLTAYFLVAAVCYAATGLVAIANFAWRQPMADQYTSYATYLEKPFPQSLIEPINGHRPVIPALINAVEIRVLHANQLLQIVVGVSSATLLVAVFAFVLWREKRLPAHARAAGTMAMVLATFWLGNARMLMHGDAAIHVYTLNLLAVVALLCAIEAKRRNAPSAWMSIGTAACISATFCFGAGIASFPAMILLGVLLRLPWRSLAIPTAGLLLCAVAYLYALPSAGGVQHSLHFAPLASATLMARLISSPWINAWLGSAAPAIQQWLPSSLDRSALGRAVHGSAEIVQDSLGMSWFGFSSIVIGLAGVFGFVFAFWHLARRGLKPTGVEPLALGLGIFVLAISAIVGIGRLALMRELPYQIFADRYLLWPCLFWASLVMLGLPTMAAPTHRLARTAALAALVLVPIVLVPTHRGWAGWASVVYRSSQQGAAAARSGIIDERRLPWPAEASRATALHTLDLLRENHLAMFADPAWQLVGTRWHGAIDTESPIQANVNWTGGFTEKDNGRSAGQFEGWIIAGARMLKWHAANIVVIDSADMVVGVAEFSFIKPESKTLLLKIPVKRGFDGYVRDPQPNVSYRLILLDSAAGHAVQLAELTAPANRLDSTN